MTVEEVKRLLRLKDTSYDEYLSAVIPLIIQFVQQYCNRDFVNENGQVVLPGGIKLVVAKMCQFHMRDPNIASETLARHSISYDTNYPSEITNILNSYRRPTFV